MNTVGSFGLTELCPLNPGANDIPRKLANGGDDGSSRGGSGGDADARGGGGGIVGADTLAGGNARGDADAGGGGGGTVGADDEGCGGGIVGADARGGGRDGGGDVLRTLSIDGRFSRTDRRCSRLATSVLKKEGCDSSASDKG